MEVLVGRDITIERDGRRIRILVVLASLRSLLRPLRSQSYNYHSNLSCILDDNC